MTSQKIIRNYQLIAGIYTLSASVIWGVNTLFLLDAGLNIAEVFIANSVFTASMALFEIPTGVVADTKGRRLSFLLSIALVLIGTLGYLGAAMSGGDLLLFIAASVILGLGFTFYSGAVEAWLVDALNATNYEGVLDHVFAQGAMVTGAAMLIGSIGGGLLGSVDLMLPFWVRTGLLALVFGVAFFVMHDVGFSKKSLKFSDLPAEMGRIVKSSVAFGWRQRSIRLLILVSMIQAGFMSWVFYAWQPYFLELLGQNLIWVAGVIMALISIATIIGNTIVEWFTRFCGYRTTLLLWASAVLPSAGIAIGLVNNFWLASALLILMAGTLGVIGPVKQAYMHQLIPSQQRATVISFDSLISNGGSVASQTSLGYVSQFQSIANGFVYGGVVSLLALPLLVLLRRLKEPADQFVGTLGCQGAAAGQGLPHATHLDTVPQNEVGTQSAD